LMFEEPKTKHAAGMFGALKAVKSDITKKGNRALVLVQKMEDTIKRAMRNLPYASLDEARNLYALQTMQYKYLVFTKESIEHIK